jgi:hypothetical protein
LLQRFVSVRNQQRVVSDLRTHLASTATGRRHVDLQVLADILQERVASIFGVKLAATAKWDVCVGGGRAA